MMMMMSSRDYYDVLGVARSASPEDIKKAFRKNAKALHPDTNDSPNAEAEFKELGEAYSVLSDPQKRSVYDTYGHEGLQGQGGGGGPSNWDFMNDFGDLGDIFSAFFGGGFGGGGRSSGRGNDLRTTLHLSFMEAVFGCTKQVEAQRLASCGTCHGNGAAPGTQPQVCHHCGGHGQVRQSAQTLFGHFTQIVACPHCGGTGKLLPTPCPTCKGKGRAPQARSIEVVIPAGVDTGTRLRISGEGDAGTQGAPAGDLYVVLQVEADPLFVREGYDVLLHVPVSYTQLVLGDTLEVPLLQGKETITIKAGTPNASRMVLRGKGVPVIHQAHQRGDLILQLDVQIPQKLDAPTKALLEQLSQLEQERRSQHGTTAPQEEESHTSFFTKLKNVLLGHPH
jgi:molecular chaperone DnaJ